MNILPDGKMIAIQDIDAAFKRMERADMRDRFVLDMATLKAASERGMLAQSGRG